jgi:hypothetical protein
MSFLQKKNKEKHLFYQMQGFMTDTYLDLAGELLDMKNFKLPSITFSLSEMIALEIPERLRLGNRMEYFFSYIIENTERYNLIMKNTQVFHAKQTLGELDFILFDTQADRYIHIELGGKIYLYDPQIEPELAKWIGPNRRDSLVKKINKLREKQFPLLYKEATQAVLRNAQINSLEIEQQICLKTRLFVPKSLRDSIFYGVQNNNIVGYYIPLSDFSVADYSSYEYYLPNKQDWLVNPKYGEIWYSYKEIIPMIQMALEQKMSPLVWVKKTSTDFESFFIVWW